MKKAVVRLTGGEPDGRFLILQARFRYFRIAPARPNASTARFTSALCTAASR